MKVKKILDYNDLLKSCDIALSSVIIRRSVLKKSFKFGHTKTKEDYFLWLKLSKILKYTGLIKNFYTGGKQKTHYQAILCKNFMMHSLFIIKQKIKIF